MRLLRVLMLGFWPWAMSAQTEDEDWHPWIVEALDAGCLTRDGAEVLAAAQWPGPAPQQSVVRTLGADQGQRVLRCLLVHETWQERLFALNRHSRTSPASQATLRGGVWGMNSRGPRVRMEGRFRHMGRKLGVRGTFRASSGVGPTWLGSIGWQGPKGRWATGSLVPKVGQGSVLWSSGAFDGLGGMEGTHRIPQGWVEAGGRWRGVVDGLGWRRTSGWAASTWSVDGAILGKWWQGEGIAALWGRTPGLRYLARLGWDATGRPQAAVGMHGGGEWQGWSARWEVGGFDGGWSGRASLLRSWSAKWEAHAAMTRGHPAHPAEWSGERRASVPHPDGIPRWQLDAGLAWMGAGRGTLRWRRRQGFGPQDEALERVVCQLDCGRHRVRVQVETTPGSSQGSAWGLRWRREFQSADDMETCRIRMHLQWATGDGGAGGAWAMTARWQRSDATRWTSGVGQAWGNRTAPARYVTGWDDRPAQAFRGRDAHAFVRWASADGRWQGRLRLSWTMAAADGEHGVVMAHSWLDVEFRPHRRRRGRS